MVQIKIVTGMTAEELTSATNEFLATLQNDAVKDIHVDAENGVVTVQYIVKDLWEGHLCCDCRYWDDSNDCEAMIGLCQVCGGRRRFSNKPCEHFKDIRG